VAHVSLCDIHIKGDECHSSLHLKSRKIMKNKIILSTIFIIGAMLITQNLFGPPFDPPDGTGGTPVGVPIDGGISALIAAGIALVVRKFRKERKKKQQ